MCRNLMCESYKTILHRRFSNDYISRTNLSIIEESGNGGQPDAFSLQIKSILNAPVQAMMKELPLANVYQLLEPGPVVLLTTASSQGCKNVMTLSWHMMMEFEPPLVACIVSGNNHSFSALNDTGECVIAVPALNLAEKVVQIGNSSGRDIDKFSVTGLTPQAAKQVCAPLIAECFANLECRVVDTRMVADYNLFVLEVVQACVDSEQPCPKTIHHHGYGRFVVDGEEINLASKMR